MAGIPAYCTNRKCGAVFVNNVINIKHSLNIRLSANFITRCPRCGSEARLVNGTFNERGKGLEFVSGPPLTKAILEHLRDIAQKAQSGEITPQEAIAEAGKIDSRWARILERALKIGGAVGVFAAIITLYIQWSSYELQKADSAASAEFYKAALAILENVENGKGIDAESANPAKAKAKVKSVLVEGEQKARTDRVYVAPKKSKRRDRRQKAKAKKLSKHENSPSLPDSAPTPTQRPDVEPSQS
ncbi:hypothetical protein FQ775_03380 [Nitratireductor mangrovi]|uniref:Uncharacterized protein n=1 Tax=Nitratireductor mangrovi TaxID=2599600 RepID=A0A5B8KVF3_9HYPH|nr:hypothetical protein [Nitratireductor mangrovi]QDY99489.1 hypothetical protein FQ775_03380 [Nitratireductor mangrovi]